MQSTNSSTINWMSNCNCDREEMILTTRKRRHSVGQCLNSSRGMARFWVLILAALSTVCLLSSIAETINAQFLFSYEISPESDDSRTPKSSLFDPSSFKIVTPSQLQSSYQKIASQIDSPANAQQARLPIRSPLISSTDGTISLDDLASPAPISPAQQPQQQPQQQQSSLLKQTSAAIQSLAELFNLAPSSSPSPLGSLAVPNLDRGNLHQQQVVDQQAEARSLHEHWTQQQQRSHQMGTGAPGADSQPALASFAATTTPSSHQMNNLQFQQQQQSSQSNPQASYWLTANPLNPAADGNFLVQIRPESSPAKQQSMASSSAGSTSSSSAVPIDDGTLSAPARLQLANEFRRPKSANLAQNSFLATPTSYYPPNLSESRFEAPQASSSPASNDIEPPMASPQLQPQPPQQQQQLLQQSVQVRQAPRQQFLPNSNEDSLDQSMQLQPPANLPENFNAPQLSVSLAGQPTAVAKAHKSAEDTLISFRQQQLIGTNQNANSNANANLNTNTNPNANINANANINRQRQSNKEQFFRANIMQTSSPVQQQQQQQLQPPVNQPPPQTQQPQQPVAAQMQDIPKVSPQIYESFLLQQRDQHEKHMELLKQQQEINKLMEQRQKQQELEQQKKKRKKEEVEKEIAKKKNAARELELARKLKLELEERETRRRRDEEERKRVEEQRYQEYLEQERERERKLQLEKKRQAELKEAQEMKAKLERERKEREEREQAERRQKEAEEAKYANYVRQQEELKKLLELKEKEDELRQMRQRQVAALQQARASARTAAPVQRLASSERRERPTGAGLGSWGAPLKIRGQVLPAEVPLGEQGSSSSLGSPATSPASVAPASAQPAIGAEVTTSSSPANQGETAHHGRLTRVRVRAQHQLQFQRANRQRASNSSASTAAATAAADEKLIRQKIPLYSGPGQYGLYRGSSNNSALAADLAALLGSVTLPSSTTSTTTTSTSTTTPAPISETLDDQYSSSLSPLLNRQSLRDRSRGSAASSEQPFAFDDDVPRRPARELLGASRQTAQSQLRPTTVSFPAAAESSLAASHHSPSGGRHNEARSGNETRRAAGPAAGSRSAHIGLASLPADSDNDGIPGRAGVEYPVLSAVPPTSFSCTKQPLNGYYADTETACQVVHLCQAGVQSSILCPNGTIFNQEKFSCQWWYEVNCSKAPNFYQLNDNLYKSPSGLPAKEGESQRTSAEIRADSALASKRKLAKKLTSSSETNHLAAAAAASSSASS